MPTEADAARKNSSSWLLRLEKTMDAPAHDLQNGTIIIVDRKD
ncbi:MULTISPECIES: hypothetical protein [unclassified Paenibacillus]|nr:MULTISPECIES: hypothetical protein [unclassified Paenibacillus]MBP1155244.1 hypothetical protein [Paenibacillus sp. PvP091]MBP1169372.1 hypothetical protein [Paenibacillus sp. PvR098]MBP2440400.1 hypothetical protein [Paenibacillus sp. PvP052]